MVQDGSLVEDVSLDGKADSLGDTHCTVVFHDNLTINKGYETLVDTSLVTIGSDEVDHFEQVNST